MEIDRKQFELLASFIKQQYESSFSTKQLQQIIDKLSKQYERQYTINLQKAIESVNQKDAIDFSKQIVTQVEKETQQQIQQFGEYYTKQLISFNKTNILKREKIFVEATEKIEDDSNKTSESLKQFSRSRRDSINEVLGKRKEAFNKTFTTIKNNFKRSPVLGVATIAGATSLAALKFIGKKTGVTKWFDKTIGSKARNFKSSISDKIQSITGLEKNEGMGDWIRNLQGSLYMKLSDDFRQEVAELEAAKQTKTSYGKDDFYNSLQKQINELKLSSSSRLVKQDDQTYEQNVAEQRRETEIEVLDGLKDSIEKLIKVKTPMSTISKEKEDESSFWKNLFGGGIFSELLSEIIGNALWDALRKSVFKSKLGKFISKLFGKFKLSILKMFSSFKNLMLKATTFLPKILSTGTKAAAATISSIPSIAGKTLSVGAKIAGAGGKLLSKAIPIAGVGISAYDFMEAKKKQDVTGMYIHSGAGILQAGGLAMAATGIGAIPGAIAYGVGTALSIGGTIRDVAYDITGGFKADKPLSSDQQQKANEMEMKLKKMQNMLSLSKTKQEEKATTVEKLSFQAPEAKPTTMTGIANSTITNIQNIDTSSLGNISTLLQMYTKPQFSNDEQKHLDLYYGY